MNPGHPSLVPVQHKLNQQKVLPADSNRKSTTSCVWDDMQGWMEQRQREWDDEMTQLKNEFFSIKSDKLVTSRRSSDASSLPEKMSNASSSSRFYETGRGSRMFCVTFDVSQFEPDEVNIRTLGNSLMVHAKHEEQRKSLTVYTFSDESRVYCRVSENKSVSREFNRRVDIPSHINPDTLRCFIRDDGTLQVEAELPSSSYDSSCSVNRDDSPFAALENSSTFSDRLSDRDIGSPPRTDRDMCSTPGTDRDVCSPPLPYRDIFSPPKLYRDAYNTPRNGRDMLSPPRRDTDLYSGVVESHWTNHTQPRRDDKGSFNYQNAGDNIYAPQTMFDNPHQTAENYYGAARIDNDIYNTQRTARDDIIISSPTLIGPTSDNRTTVFRDSMSDGNRLNFHDLMARNGQARPIATENGHADGGSELFSVVVGVGTDFEPHELAVQTIDRKLVVHARHTNPHFGYGGDIYREFDLPEDVDPGSITANLTPEGTLLIEAPTNTRPYPVEPRNLPYPYHV